MIYYNYPIKPEMLPYVTLCMKAVFEPVAVDKDSIEKARPLIAEMSGNFVSAAFDIVLGQT